MALSRIPGWEARLAETIEAARYEPYALGKHDCFRLACSVVQALTAADLWPQWAGRYATKREALRRIAEFNAGGFTAAAVQLFGADPVPMNHAHRGDLAEYSDEKGQHLGIVLGASVALLVEEGLKFLPRSACRHAWRIG